MRITNTLTLFLLFFIPISQSKPVSRIVTQTDPVDAQVQSSIAIITHKHTGQFCSATVINEYWLLTAAHCLFSGNGDYVVDVGRAKNEGVHDAVVSKFIPHPLFDIGTGVHDIALVQVKEPLPNVQSSASIQLYAGKKSLAKRKGIAAGYGRSDNGVRAVLNQKELKILSIKSCRKALQNRKYQIPPSFNKKYYLCVGQDSVTCFGDSGGPLIIKDSQNQLVQLGVLSSGGTCKEEGVPNIYTAISGHLKWIKEQVTGNIRTVDKLSKSKKGKKGKKKKTKSKSKKKKKKRSKSKKKKKGKKSKKSKKSKRRK